MSINSHHCTASYVDLVEVGQGYMFHYNYRRGSLEDVFLLYLGSTILFSLKR